MSKELTPLEALEKIDHTVCLAFDENNNALFNRDCETHIDCKDIYEFCDCYKIIETALKILEQLQVIIGAEKVEDLPKLALETENTCYSACYNLKETENKLKALEIIKECFDLNGFDELVPNNKWFESEEKQNLLKEVL